MLRRAFEGFDWLVCRSCENQGRGRGSIRIAPFTETFLPKIDGIVTRLN